MHKDTHVRKKDLQNENGCGLEVIHIRNAEKPQKIELYTNLFTLSTKILLLFERKPSEKKNNRFVKLS